MNRTLRMLSACNKMLTRISSEQELLTEICRIAVDIGGYRMAWVGFARHEKDRTIEPMAHAGYEEGYLAEVIITWSETEPRGHGPGGQTIRGGVPVVCEDISNYPGFAWPEQALLRGYRGVVCLPLRDETHTFGILALYSGEVQILGSDEIRLLQELADNVAFGLDYIRTNNQVREQAALLDAAPEALIVYDLKHRVIYWNKGAERIYGLTASEVLGHDSALLLQQDPSKRNQAFVTLMEKGEWQGEMSSRTKDGRELLIEVCWTLLRDPEGNPKSILARNSDITERKRTEAQIFRSQRMESIGTLAGGIAHDLNNVLAPILMATDLLRDEVNDEARGQILRSMKESVVHGSELIRQVLSFAKGVSGQRIRVDANHLIKAVGKIIFDTFPKNIFFEVASSKDPWIVIGDPTQLHQVLMNLCVNARDAMPGGGKLRITTENLILDEIYAGMNSESKPGPYIKINVSDTGTGMPADVRDKMFEPFFTTKETGKGTGLGLSTAMAIVKSHGGFINVTSEIGKGSTFKVYLPADVDIRAEEEAEAQQSQLARGNGELVLLVDDEESLRNVAKRTLECYGYRVLLACNGAEAVAIYAERRNEIAVVLTDMAMPVMDGSATIHALRALNPKVKIIGSSGFSSKGGATNAMRAGVKHFIPKPYSADKILKILADCLKEEC